MVKMVAQVLLFAALAAVVAGTVLAQDAVLKTPPVVSTVPIVPGQTVSPETVSAKDADAYREGCLAKIPRRFTPQAHEAYCTCSAAAIQAFMTVNEYNTIRDPKNQKPGNAAFEKYVSAVIKPCMEFPAQDVVYLECVLDRANDKRISNIPQFCQCMASKASQHVVKNGDVDAMLLLGSKFDSIDDPVQAMLRSSNFIQVKQNAKTQCMIARFNK